jgi:magnesium chelatase subunit I
LTAADATTGGATFPFTAVVGQDALKTALALVAIEPRLGGLLIFGDRGTGKSTAVRALARLLPSIDVVAGCAYACDPGRFPADCVEGCPRKATAAPATERRAVRVVDLPLGATEDRLVGALDLERALGQGVKAFEPGLLARAHRGILYIDEVNLLEDHLVDLLLDVAASGENLVERDGLSVRHPARLVLVGTGNPEEGELRPQLLDRFGLSVDVRSPSDIATRVKAIRHRDAFERDPAAFAGSFARREERLRERLARARAAVDRVVVPRTVLRDAARLSVALAVDGLRGELTLVRAARALAAFERQGRVARRHLLTVAPMALAHRLRRDPLDEVDGGDRVARALADLFPAAAGA